MKKILVTIAASLLCIAAFAQGTVNFDNTIYKISSGVMGGTTFSAVPTTSSGLIQYGLFYGIGQSTSLTLASPLGVNSTSTTGVIASSTDSRTKMNVYALASAPANSTDVWVQIGGWSYSFGTNWEAAQTASLDGSGLFYFGTSAVVNINALGAPTGPGVAIFEGSAGTNPKLINAFRLYTTIPEPSAMVLAGLGAAALLIFRRRS